MAQEQAQEKSQVDEEETIIFQLGTNNWQVQDEPTSGSGILHQAHHNTYNAMNNVHCYSIWPSGNCAQSTESYQKLYDKNDKLANKTRVYGLDGDIPVCESNHPGSSRRWHSMTSKDRAKYYNECFEMCYNFLDDIETKYHPNKTISLIIVHHTFLNPIIMQGVLQKRAQNNKSTPPVAVFIHGTGIKMYENELAERNNNNMDEKEKEFVLKTTPIEGITDDKIKKYDTFLDWIRDDLKMFDGTTKYAPQLGYAISPKSLAAFTKVFTKFSKDNLIMSPNGIDTSVVKECDTSIAEVIKGLKTFPAKKGVTARDVPSVHEPSGKEWSHLIVHVSKMADWKRPDSVLYAFNKLLKEYPNALLLMIGQGTPEVNLKYQTLCDDTLKLGNNCFFVGQKMLDKLAEFYSAANVGIFPSKDEPFGMVFIECMICGTPVIGANSGGPVNFMEKDDKNDKMCKTGVLVDECDDNVEMGSKLGDYLIDSIKNDWKTSMKEECKKFQEKYTVQTQCENLLDETKKLLKNQLDTSLSS